MSYLRNCLLLCCALLALALPDIGAAGWGDSPAEQPAAPAEGPAEENAGAETATDSPSADTPINDPAWEKWAFYLPLMDGSRTVSFASLARTGKPFIVVWWQSDCSVCHLQLPYVQQLAKLAEQEEIDLQVVSVNIDASDSECARFVRDKSLSFPVLRDPRARRTDRIYKVREEGTPVTYVFKGGGAPAGSFSGFRRGYPQHVLELLGQTLPAATTARAEPPGSAERN